MRDGWPEIVGVNNDEDPPVPIPNTEVKLIRVDNTWREAAREDRSAPTQRKERRLCLLSFFAYTNHSNMGEDFKRVERKESPDVFKYKRNLPGTQKKHQDNIIMQGHNRILTV